MYIFARYLNITTRTQSKGKSVFCFDKCLGVSRLLKYSAVPALSVSLTGQQDWSKISLVIKRRHAYYVFIMEAALTSQRQNEIRGRS